MLKETHWNPLASDVALVIEIAESSLVTDRYKATLYAEALIPHYWIVNLNERTIEVYSLIGDAAGQYGEPQVFRETDSVPVAIFGFRAETILAVELLP